MYADLALTLRSRKAASKKSCGLYKKIIRKCLKYANYHIFLNLLYMCVYIYLRIYKNHHNTKDGMTGSMHAMKL